MANTKLIITREDMAQFRPLAKEIPQERITPYILEAQTFDLEQLLGPALYLDFLTKFDSTGDPKYAAYQALLNGGNYTYGDITIENPGLIGYLSYSTLVRFFNNNHINATRYGLVQFNNSDSLSAPLDIKAISIAVAELRSNALAFQARIIKFLTTRGTDYPLYNYQDGSALNKMGVQFFDLNNERYGSRNGRTLTSF